MEINRVLVIMQVTLCVRQRDQGFLLCTFVAAEELLDVEVCGLWLMKYIMSVDAVLDSCKSIDTVCVKRNHFFPGD